MKFLLLLLSASVLYAGADMSKMYSYYQDDSFVKACDFGIKRLSKHKKDNKFISLYAFSCLNANRLDRLALPITLLNQSEEDRKNAAFFSVILMQKKLLIASLKDGMTLSSLKLPTTDHLLSIVFDLYQEAEFKKIQKSYKLQDKNSPRKSYKLYYKSSGSTIKIVIEEYYDTIMKKRYIIN